MAPLGPLRHFVTIAGNIHVTDMDVYGLHMLETQAVLDILQTGTLSHGPIVAPHTGSESILSNTFHTLFTTAMPYRMAFFLSGRDSPEIKIHLHKFSVTDRLLFKHRPQA